MATKQNSTTSTALTLKGKARLVHYLDKNYQAIVAVMEKPCEKQRIKMALENAIRRNYQIAGCTTMSVFNALATCYRDGLEIGPNEAYLVPFKSSGKNICTLIYDYKGLITIAYQDGVLSYTEPFLVYEGEEYSFRNGIADHDPKAPPNPADLTDGVIAGYCRTRLASGVIWPVKPVWAVELIKIKEMATAKLKRQDGPWFSWGERMYMKSIVKRQFHTIPRNHRRITGAIEVDNAFERGEPTAQVVDVEFNPEDDKPLDPEYVSPEYQEIENDDLPKRKPKET